MKFGLRVPVVAAADQQANNEDLLNGVNTLAQFVFSGRGVPSFTPPGAALYFRRDFGTNTAVYVYDGAWKSVT